MDKDLYIEYCTGCGLCHSEEGINFKTDKRGYSIPRLEDKDISFCMEMCPASGKASKYMNKERIWGNYINVYEGWSTNEYIRKNSSSGGILTAVSCYLLEYNIVDGIIQTKASSRIPYETETVVSRTVDEVKECSGSRYSVSMPLYNLSKIIKENEKYAIVAKPCDISTLRMYIKKNKKYEEQIKYFLSFFCAGMPSKDAQIKLLNELGCKDESQCTFLRYRGKGWPGYAVAINENRIKEKMPYEKAWGTILGRDVRKCCRFCFDGIGEFADISCGDLWYLTADKKPDFNERDGRNVIFARTKKGDDLLKNIYENGKIYIKNTNVNELKYVQKYQYDRKAFMKSMILGLKLCKKKYPLYDNNTINSFSKLKSLKQVIRRTLGIIKRVKKGKI